MPTTHPLPGALREFARLAAQLLGGDVAWPIRVTLKDRCGTAHQLYLEAPAGGADAAPDAERDTSGTGVPPAVPPAVPPVVPRPAKKKKKSLPELDAAVRASPVARAVLAAAGLAWQETVDLATAAGQTYCGRFRQHVAALVRLGYLERQAGTKKLRKLKDLEDD
jgi:hypothetical protein